MYYIEMPSSLDLLPNLDTFASENFQIYLKVLLSYLSEKVRKMEMIELHRLYKVG